MTTIKITEEELEYLMSLTIRLQTLDWDEAEEYFQVLANKYHFDAKKCTVDSNTGEINELQLHKPKHASKSFWRSITKLFRSSA